MDTHLFFKELRDSAREGQVDAVTSVHSASVRRAGKLTACQRVDQSQPNHSVAGSARLGAKLRRERTASTDDTSASFSVDSNAEYAARWNVINGHKR